MEFTVAFMVGALVATYLVSRLLLWVTKSWDGGITRIAVVHVFSWLIAAFVGGMGMADGGAFAGAQAAAAYAIPQAVWFIVDIVRHRRRLREIINTAQISN